MTKPKAYTYQIQYNDNTYRIVDWTKIEFKEVAESLANQQAAAVLDDGVFVLYDVRAIVLLPEVEEETEEKTKEKEQHLTEWGFVDADTAAWLKNAGIDIVNGGSAE